ncbi:hypothetical protein [Glutamicibacter sp.]|uniref:hypothetical protein n=1 Tax=Glutamicibacter sp. TaxID=1931995 RepID=UPI002FDA5718
MSWRAVQLCAIRRVLRIFPVVEDNSPRWMPIRHPPWKASLWWSDTRYAIRVKPPENRAAGFTDEEKRRRVPVDHERAGIDRRGEGRLDTPRIRVVSIRVKALSSGGPGYSIPDLSP